MQGNFDETMAASHINERCIAIGNCEDFSAQLHGRV